MKGSELIFAIMAASNKSEYSVSELIQLCSLFDINESQLRTNLSRMSAKGLLKFSRKGKSAFYRLADRGASLKQNVALSFEQLDWSDWDKKWWGVSFSVPDKEKSERHYIRKKLTVYRFVSYHPGFWVRPLNRTEKLEQHLEKVFSNKYCCAIQFDFFNKISPKEVSALWNLYGINKDFEYGLEIVKESRRKTQGLAPKEAYKEKIITGNTIVNILFKDPLLPDIYLPENWAAIKLKREFALWNKEITESSKIFIENLNKGGV